jgi:ABC-2 type transport system ATP-binding protein
LGTPAELKARLGLKLLEFRPLDVARAARELEQRKPIADDPIADVQTYGDRIDVLVSDAVLGGRRVRSVLGPVDVTPSSPTLENVFVEELRRLAGGVVVSPAFPFRAAVDDHSGLAIRAKGLEKHFGEFAAVRDLDLEVRYGEVVGLLGANGAGKTTTIKMLCGLLEPSAGRVEVAGHSDNLRAPSLRQRIGYMSQRFTLYDDLTVEQNLDFYAGVYGLRGAERRAKIEWALASCELAGQRNRLAKTLPGGWKQRVAFGASILHEPEILFLDEPTSGVDPLARRELWRAIDERARRGTAVLVTTHYLEEAEHCGSVLFMAAGSVVARGSPSAIKASVGGKLIEVSGEHSLAAFEALEEAFDPWRVALFGDRVHVVVDGAEQLERVRNVAARAGGNPALREIPFSLEDAFIDIVSRVAR